MFPFHVINLMATAQNNASIVKEYKIVCTTYLVSDSDPILKLDSRFFFFSKVDYVCYSINNNNIIYSDVIVVTSKKNHYKELKCARTQ